MCGIIGYIGGREASPILINGLKRLEYRGYDSAGIAVISNQGIRRVRKEGKLSELEKEVLKSPPKGQAGIGHTRWATHGMPTERNAHPHQVGKVAVVHNGIIENYLELKRLLGKKGRKFSSETDSEVIAHLIDEELSNGRRIEVAIQKAIKKLKGAFAVVALVEGETEKIFAFKRASPLIIGLGEGENFVASDIPALLDHTKKIIPMEDDEYAVISREQVEIFNSKGRRMKREPILISWSPLMAEKAGFKHFMLKEIFEQPRVLTDTLSGRILLEKVDVKFDELDKDFIHFLKNVRQIYLTACGTAYHASLVGKQWLERFTKIPCFCEIASEFRYREPLIDKNTLVILVSQSGETADTLAGMEEAKKRGAKTLAVCNVLGSTLARKSDQVIFTRAGPEIGVASTKAFLTQLAILYLFAIYMAQLRQGIEKKERKELIQDLLKIPALVEQILETDPAIEEIAHKYYQSKGFFYIARGINFPIALEGALKLKEISYIHAEGYPAGELKHGPIALIDQNSSVVALAPSNRLFAKTFSNLEEVSTRQGRVIAIGNPDQERRLKEKAQDVILVPKVREELEPLVLTPPLQLFAYHIAVFNGTDVDQPRNLAKSVTVE